MNQRTQRWFNGFIVAILSFGFATFANNREVLQPPWFIFQERLNMTIGQDNECVKVYPLQKLRHGKLYLAAVHVTCNDIAKTDSLATLLTKTHEFSSVVLNVTVYDYEGVIVDPKPFPKDISGAKKLMSSALSGNYYFVQLDHGNAYFDFFAEFKKEVVQFHADNADDAYSNINEVVAHAFHKVLGLESIDGLSIGTSTSM